MGGRVVGLPLTGKPAVGGGGHKGESYGVGHEGDRPEKDKKVLQSLL